MDDERIAKMLENAFYIEDRINNLIKREAYPADKSIWMSKSRPFDINRLKKQLKNLISGAYDEGKY